MTLVPSELLASPITELCHNEGGPQIWLHYRLGMMQKVKVLRYVVVRLTRPTPGSSIFRTNAPSFILRYEKGSLQSVALARGSKKVIHTINVLCIVYFGPSDERERINCFDERKAS